MTSRKHFLNFDSLKENQKILINFAVLFVLIYLIIFLKLGNFHMRWWDESMFAVNAYEMNENEKYFSLYYNGHPDLHNSKPPLIIWLQVMFVKVMGYNELAIRLPSAIASCLSIIFVFLFLKKRFNYVFAWSGALILLTSSGFIGFHGTRAGDSDALLTLLLLMANLNFINSILQQDKMKILYVFIFLTLAFLTKLYAAFLFFPGYIFLLIYHKKFKDFVFNKFFVIGILIFVISVFTMIYLREMDTSGYINAVVFNDAGRLFDSDDLHKASCFYYFDNFFESRFTHWFLCFIAGVIILYFERKNTVNRPLFMILVLTISYLSIIVLSTFKAQWYDLPVYPYLAIISGFAIYKIIGWINQKYGNLGTIKKCMIIIVLCFYPYRIQFANSQNNPIETSARIKEANEMYLFYKISRNPDDLNGVKVLYHGWNGSLLFYKYKLRESGQSIELCTSVNKIKVGDKVLVALPGLKKELRSAFEIELIDQHFSSELFLIK